MPGLLFSDKICAHGERDDLTISFFSMFQFVSGEEKQQLGTFAIIFH